jgi:hypothetical protein
MDICRRELESAECSIRPFRRDPFRVPEHWAVLRSDPYLGSFWTTYDFGIASEEMGMTFRIYFMRQLAWSTPEDSHVSGKN